MFTVDFWRLTAERAARSFAQSLLAVLSVGGLGLLEVDWLTALSTAGMATLLSVLTSVGGAHIGPDNDPGFVRVPEPATQPAALPEPAAPAAA
jgi:hypothetical protein